MNNFYIHKNRLTRNNGIMFHCSSNNHNRVVKRSLRLVQELLSPSSQNDGGSFRLCAPLEQVVSLSTNLGLIEGFTRAKICSLKIIHGRQDGPSTCLQGTFQIILGDTTGTKHVPKIVNTILYSTVQATCYNINTLATLTCLQNTAWQHPQLVTLTGQRSPHFCESYPTSRTK